MMRKESFIAKARSEAWTYSSVSCLTLLSHSDFYFGLKYHRSKNNVTEMKKLTP